MSKSLAIEVSDNAFLPEAYAYQRFFNQRGLHCQIVKKGGESLLAFDGIILFHGFHPFWHKYPPLVVGEYHSLSVGRFSRIKDLIKRLVNVRSSCYIFLNDSVRKNMFFRDAPNVFIRGMGVNEYQGSATLDEHDFDIIYCGSERLGVRQVVQRLVGLGFSVAIVGFDWGGDLKGIVNFGKVDQAQVSAILSRATYGLNYTPDVHPLNIQDSTKVLEYCASGLKVITNKYYWVTEFEKKRNARFLDVNKIVSRKDLVDFDFCTPDVRDLEWEKVIRVSGFGEFVINNI